MNTIYSDKTGTLTKNDIRFSCFTIGDKTYEKLPGEEDLDFAEYKRILAQDENNPERKIFLEYIKALALCHTVHIDIITGSDENGQPTTNKEYKSTSADEVAFVEFTKKVGIIFEGEDHSGAQRISDKT